MVSFRGASAEAMATLTDRVGGVAEGSAATVAGDLFAAAASFRSEGTLRRFATDQSVAAQAREGVVRDVFAGKVDPAALEVVATAAGQRWTRVRDLADALEELGVVAAVRSVGLQASTLVDELFGVRQLVTANSDLRNALSDPTRSVADKAGLVESLLAGKTLPATVQLTRQALSGSYRTVVAALEDYERTAAQVNGEGVATVHAARPLDPAVQQRLTTALSRQYGRPVHLNIVVDPTVVGGLRVEIGDDVIDGTVSSRLDDARRKIAG
ncbi:F0F1 ATP synthase subunit delta [Pimelobacter simplex]|uniref:ATP synthase subunit delta n=1 Tax=Nocardioides simplex TaxID=2045 RepID=A0A0A1DIF8_NOCSI|nr:F0F1 ATP synthase subunit delta [Pimelobacter simplex]AIY17069.1 ATP synthase delta chain [Pimelobacter simplex]KAB2808867.1 F0F1 ATP synthase subunit delta [Pimelobacter simplex]MCG8151798.1 F0F1 ATP synthase subunit delta [Pimelobacter simplex]SFM50616.1 ATP synthase F1 subcomplex delta subunit [Pimelobacter simplex]GEB13027.1 ATP synthase subunit delta [Pimelobacter simplex]